MTLCDDKAYALTLFEHAIELAPELAVAHWCVANLHRGQARYREAAKQYERAVEAEPDNWQA